LEREEVRPVRPGSLERMVARNDTFVARLQGFAMLAVSVRPPTPLLRDVGHKDDLAIEARLAEQRAALDSLPADPVT
jgi:hypothetical protein